MKADKTNIKNTELLKPGIWKTEMAFLRSNVWGSLPGTYETTSNISGLRIYGSPAHLKKKDGKAVLMLCN